MCIRDSTTSTASTGTANTATTSGVRVTTLTTPSRQANGLVTVILPQGSASAAAGMVIALPQEVTTAAQNTNTQVVATLPNGQALPSWIRYDSAQKAIVTGADARAAFPITVVLNVGEQRTLIVLSESQQR